MIKIKDKLIDNYCEPFIIAEIGANHNGNMELAKKMILTAKQKGADCVKFQSWSKDSIFSKVVYEENYFLADDYRTRNDYTLKEIVDEFSINEDEHRILKEYCDKIGIVFSTTPFSKREVDFIVDELNVDFIKVASMDLNNYPFLDYIARKNKPIMLSTGLSNLSEIDKAVNTIKKAGNEDFVLLHCVSIYPTPIEQTNLNTVDMLRNVYNVPIGYSDHTNGVTAPILSIAKGVCVIEKHFTLDKEMFGWDHKISADPFELATIVQECKNAQKMLGNYYKVVNESDERKEAFRRSIVAARNIKVGDTIREEDLDYKRPGSGIEPGYKDFIIGKIAKRTIQYDELIRLEDF